MAGYWGSVNELDTGFAEGLGPSSRFLGYISWVYEFR
jgi:hypothetical protein